MKESLSQSEASKQVQTIPITEETEKKQEKSNTHTHTLMHSIVFDRDFTFIFRKCPPYGLNRTSIKLEDAWFKL